MIIRKVTEAEMPRVNQLFNIAFEMSFQGEPCITPGPGVQSWAAFDGDAMMSTFTTSDYQIRFDGHSCKMAGLGGVATLPQYRRMGGIRECFKACLPSLYRENYDFSYLYPFSTGYYRKFGYECCVQKLLVSVDLGLLKPRPQEGHFVLCEADHPMKDAIRQVDRFWEEQYNMMVIHEDRDYKWTEKFDPAENLTFTYVYFDRENQPKAYTTFRMENQPDGRNLVCSKFFFTDREGFEGLMLLFKSMSTDHRFVKFQLPAGCSMEYLLPEWSMGAAQWSVQNAGMVRVINAASVLRKAAYHGTGSLTVEITDPQIEENNGIFRVSFRDGRAETVEKVSAQPDVRLTVAAFSALIAGAIPFREAALYLGGVEVLNPTMALSQAFRRKPMMIADYF